MTKELRVNNGEVPQPFSCFVYVRCSDRPSSFLFKLHKFLKSLPKNVSYFAATKENELVFLKMPQMEIPKVRMQMEDPLNIPVHLFRW